MRKQIAISLALLCAVSIPLFTKAQEKSEPQIKLVQFYMALLKKGPKWSADGQSNAQTHDQRVKYALSLLDSGKAIIFGGFQDEGDIRGVYIFRASSAEEAKAWAEADPTVTSGYSIVEMHPWWAADVMKKPATPLKLETAYLAFLSHGPKWTPEKTPATEELQKAHLANVNRLAEMKKLVVAGPFGDHGNLAGIFVFRVSSLEEAQSLAATDPAVKAGRLVLDVHPWTVPAGVLPQ